MTKKILLVLAIILAFTANLVFAATSDMVSNAGNSVKNVVSDIGNGIKDGAEDIKEGVQGVGNGTSNVMKTEENNMADNSKTTGITNANNDRYNATRTATTTNVNSNNTMTWTWFILAVATILIVGLVWYYGTQNDTRTNRNEH